MSSPGTDLLLDDVRCDALRDAVTDAVLVSSPGLREALDQDPDASLTLVVAARVAAEQTSQLLRDAVASARGAGHSWDTVGRLLGVSRQAAQQRFGTPSPSVTGGADGRPERRVLTPLTAFTEMAVLEREGLAGWHVVEFGPLFHVMEASEHRWAHRRAVWSPGTIRRMAAEGWMRVPGATFPWGYFKRRLD